jgi:hypothetical protein
LQLTNYCPNLGANNPCSGNTIRSLFLFSTLVNRGS